MDTDTAREKLQRLGYEPAEWQLPNTEERIGDFEQQYGLRLPAEYRQFLLDFGGWVGSALCDIQERPTPIGDKAWIDLFYGFVVPEHKTKDIRWLTDTFGAAPTFVPVADGGMNGCLTVIKCGQPQDGYVYFFDADQRSLWPDRQFYEMFPALGQEIVKYLDYRRSGRLPLKPAGYESLYLLSRSFGEFIEALSPSLELED